MKRIACFHLFNDYSGSPKMLKAVVSGLTTNGYSVDLITSRGGVLDEIKGKANLRMRQYDYTFSRNVAIRAMRYAWVQLQVFFIALGYVFKKDTVIYINTILPVGAALGGRIAGKRVIYHYHENAKAKSTAYRILAKVMQLIASDIICVSKYQRQFLRRKKRVYIIPNALQTTFTQQVTPDAERAFESKRVLMLGSLKKYKGTKEFIELARRLKDFNFELVLNESEDNIAAYLQEYRIEIPANLDIHPRQNDVVPFYGKASVVVNLSDKHRFIETFGLTALEAMTAGLPVIVPTVGGIAEMVEDGKNGYRIDADNLDKIEHCIQDILTNKKLFLSLAKNALEYSAEYSEKNMLEMIGQVFTKPA